MAGDGEPLPASLDRIDPTAYRGWGPAPIPDPRDEVVTRLVDGLAAAGPAAVARACTDLDEGRANVLRAYAERMANVAVRTTDRTALSRGVVALVVGGLHSGRRDAMRGMALLDDAARRIDVDLERLVDEVARDIGDDGATCLRTWLRRPPELRRPGVMGFAAVTSHDDGFRYVERDVVPGQAVRVAEDD